MISNQLIENIVKPPLFNNSGPFSIYFANYFRATIPSASHSVILFNVREKFIISSSQGGAVAFPLMVPVLPSDRYVADFRMTRRFLSTNWKKPTLILYSEQATIPALQRGDFIVGNRRLFYKILIPHARFPPPVKGGHVVMYDNPKAVGHHIKKFVLH